MASFGHEYCLFSMPNTGSDRLSCPEYEISTERNASKPARRSVQASEVSGADRKLRRSRNQGEIQAGVAGSDVGAHPTGCADGDDDRRLLVFRAHPQRRIALSALSLCGNAPVAVFFRRTQPWDRRVGEPGSTDHEGLLST